MNKIPFGLRESDNQLVDVHDVPRGKLCHCVCPSCRTPLEARQGVVNSWYFAHVSKKVYKETKNECRFSFYLSLRLMARQLIGKRLALCLPEYVGTVEYYDGLIRSQQSREFIVTGKSDITLTDIEVEANFFNIAVDIIGAINSFKFIIYFTHPDRSIPEKLFNPENNKCGILEISLLYLQDSFKNARNENKTYYEILINFLIHDISSKSWIYHPNFKKCSEFVINDLMLNSAEFTCIKIYQNNHTHFSDDTLVNKEPSIKPKKTARPASEFRHYFPQKPDKKMNDFIREYENNKSIQQSEKMNQFICRLCQSQWSGGTNICPKCDTHLYTSKIAKRNGTI